MKKMTFLACAAMLTSAIAFTGCNSEQNGPEKKTEAVKTQFSIALPNQLNNGARRMPEANVQKHGISTFQGMEAITLVPFAKQGAITSSDVRLGDNITTASTPVAAMAVSKADIQDHPSKAKVFEDVSIPLTTGSFLFYAKSAATGTKYQTGSLIVKNLANDKQPADFRFCLEQILADPSPLFATGNAGDLLLKYMSSVANATDGTKAWSTYTVAENQALHDMYAAFTSAHGLSSFEVARMMTDLYKSFMTASSPIATAIKAAIANATYATVNTTTGEVTLVSGLLDFPISYGIPEGSVDIKWDATNSKFVEGDYTNMAKPNTFVYPAQLWYYVNSTIKTSNQSRQTMYDNTNDWATILGAHTDALSVNTRTRAVAIKDPIQYAVARFDVMLRLDAEALADNSDLVEGAATNVNCAGGFPVTGILVGGQKDAIFDFTTAGSVDVTGISAYTVYDSIVDPKIVAEKNGSNYSDTVSTLVLENGNEDVMIAIEMLNNKADFYGAGNQLIPLNSKFYVVAKLEVAAASQTSGHVFKQDYTTLAKLTLRDLRTAYNTIPDLRTPQLELGFSVDLNWQEGNVYELNFQ